MNYILYRLIIKASITAEAAPTDTKKIRANSMYLLELALSPLIVIIRAT